MIYQIYEWHLLQNLENTPQVVCFMISDAEMENDPVQMKRIIEWCLEISEAVKAKNPQSSGITEIIIHISTPNQDKIPTYIEDIKEIATIAEINIHHGNSTESYGNGVPVTIAIGKSGREEIADAIQAMVADNITPDQVTTDILEMYLTFSHTPDCVIKTGGAHLVDFLIWQSVYSELFFLDLNWERIRKIDLIRAFRDYQSRNRRFGA